MKFCFSKNYLTNICLISYFKIEKVFTNSENTLPFLRLSGISPFAGDDVMETYSNIGLVDYDFDCEEFDECSDAAVDFIEKLLLRKPG